MRAIIIQKGGKGSGNWGHAGRPGKIGGSAPQSGVGAAMSLRTGKTAKIRQAQAANVQPPNNIRQNIEIAAKARQYHDVTDVEYLDSINYPEDYREPMNVMDSFDDLVVSEYGGGYFITGDGTLVDLTPEFGPGTNDHPGGQIAISNPAMVNVPYSATTKLAAENLKDEFGDGWMDAYEGVWSNLQKTNTRISVGNRGGGMSIQSPTMDNNTLKQIQSWNKENKLPAADYIGRDIYWEAWDGAGWMNTSYDKLLAASSLSDFSGDELVLFKEYVLKGRIVIKGVDDVVPK